MTAYTSVMKAGKYEDEMIPHLAVHAFHQAFMRACQSADVVYVKDSLLMRRTRQGQEHIVKDMSYAYADAPVSALPLKRKKLRRAPAEGAV